MTQKRRAATVAIASVILAAMAVAAYTIDPADCRWAPKCAFHALTGWQCPGCGISRAAHAALHGRWAEALGYNWFFLISIPYAMAVAVVTAWPRLSVRRYVTHRYVAYTYVVLFMAWWVVRNIAGW